MDTVQPDRRAATRATDPERKGRRAEPRAPLRYPVAIETLDGKKRISLVEASLSGARLEGPDLPAPGKDAVLICGAVEAFGTIVWVAGERCGMQFDEPLAIPELMALRRVAMTGERAGMTADEQQAAADWQNGLAR